jgi:FkbH-like protein
MYELEIAHTDRSAQTLSAEQRQLFRDADAEIVGFSLIPWEEHCTECAMPACFTTCDLYEARPDGKCRRFTHGIAPVHDVPSIQGYAVRIQFKRWAQLMAYANTRILPLPRLRSIEGKLSTLDRAVSSLPGSSLSIAGRRNVPARMQRRLKQWTSRSGMFADADLQPDYFLVEVFNPDAAACQMTLRLIAPEAPANSIPYQQLLEVVPGFNRFKFDCGAIFARVDPKAAIHATITPNEAEDSARSRTLYFGSLGFVADLKYRAAQAARNATVSDKDKTKPVKIVVWDLDHTMWQGVLVEDGPAGIKLKPGVVEVIKQLDARGIVNSVASKNDHDHAMEQLKRFGISEYLVFSRIGWGPKGDALKQIVRDFNVGADTVVFLDDQPFERDQVRQIEPKIRTFDAAEYLNILGWPGFNPPQSAESAGRREFYKMQRVRDQALESFSGEYFDFLRECEIRLTVARAANAWADRLHELVQRTNQLNFSGRRYSRDEISGLLCDPKIDHFALSCSDRYGEYGVIGFAVVDKSGAVPVLRDLMLSCRVQSKRVEHAFFSYLMKLYQSQGFAAFEAVYRKTERNQPAGKVFGEVGFVETGSSDNVIDYRYEFSRGIPEVDVVTVVEVSQPT